MPARLIAGDEVLYVKLGGDKDEFAAQLARVKALPGKRFNGNHPEHKKVWEVPDDDASLLKLVSSLQPEMNASLLARVRGAKQEQSEELVTSLPDDAPVSVPWQDRLAPKQRAGIDFMANAQHAILADDMGAGKTVQAISTVYESWIRENGDAPFTGRVLVIAPASVLDHWRRELKKWAGVEGDQVVIIDAKTPAKRAEQLAAVPEGGWCLVNWEKLQKRTKLAGESKAKPGPLDKVKWYGVIADEAHRAKNHDSQQSKALQRLRAPIQIAASGTPVLNNPGELYALLHWLRPEQYTSYWAFYYNYTEFYKGYQGRDVIIGVKNADKLRFELADKMVRRTKREIHPDIPEPFEPILYEPPMGAKQQKLYDEAENAFWLEIVQDFKKWEADEGPSPVRDPAEFLGELEAGAQNLDTLKLMISNAAARTTRLRQIATSPAVLGGDDNSSKLDEVTNLVVSSGETPWVWFGWFKDTIGLMVARLQAKGIDARGFTGDESREERADIAAAFQAEEFQVICGTIGVMKEGIDLWRAQHCGFVEEDWVPGMNQQAFDRVDRKGQTGRPQRHIIRTPDTVDTGKIAPKLSTKELIVDSLIRR